MDRVPATVSGRFQGFADTYECAEEDSAQLTLAFTDAATADMTAAIVPLRPANAPATTEGSPTFPVSHVRKLSVYGHLIMLRRSAGGPTKVVGEASAVAGAPAQAVRRGGASVSPATHVSERTAR